jgi:hypothetical protein
VVVAMCLIRPIVILFSGGKDHVDSQRQDQGGGFGELPFCTACGGKGHVY